jgi:hypothetical protein
MNNGMMETSRHPSWLIDVGLRNESGVALVLTEESYVSFLPDSGWWIVGDTSLVEYSPRNRPGLAKNE